MGWTIENERKFHGAIQQDENGRYFVFQTWTGKRAYGYSTTFTGAYVCYTCGHLCECEI